jgi:hypothetical protein
MRGRRRDNDCPRDERARKQNKDELMDKRTTHKTKIVAVTNAER